MPGIIVFAAGNYRYIPAVFQYSGGVAAEEGYAIERARFMKPRRLAQAFDAVEAHLKSIGRPTTAFAHCELRSAEPFTEQGFIEFNQHYVTTLERWGLYKGGVNPVPCSPVCSGRRCGSTGKHPTMKSTKALTRVESQCR